MTLTTTTTVATTVARTTLGMMEVERRLMVYSKIMMEQTIMMEEINQINLVL